MKDWIDTARDRTTLYGQGSQNNPRDLRPCGPDSALLSVQNKSPDRHGKTRQLSSQYSTKQVREYFSRNGNSTIFTIDNEQWSLKKILRRFIWHGRIHGKAIVHALQKQKDLGLINGYEDPFHFET